MKINDKFFHFPPFLSVSWMHVTAVHYENETLFVHLTDGNVISIQLFPNELVPTIFSAHAAYLEKAQQPRRVEPDSRLALPGLHALLQSETSGDAQVKFGFGAFDSLGMTLQHNPAQSNAPDLPKEILSRIASVAKMIAADDPTVLPKGEPHCNCFHCQISRAMQQGAGQIEEEKSAAEAMNEEEEVKDEELAFEQWKIISTGDQMFNVINKLDEAEKYTVFLGEPMGCTCGKNGCEHIIAVLKT